MAECTQEQTAACERAMDQLDALADAWAVEVNLPSLIKAATSPMGLNNAVPANIKARFRDRMEAQIDAIVRQAFIEAYMRGADSRRQFDDIQMSRLLEELAEVAAGMGQLQGGAGDDPQAP